MVRDYHIHPTVVQDAERFDAFASKAIQTGIEEVCITDHMPLSTSNASDRIPAGEVAKYCSTVREIARRYEGRLSVRLGIEIDYHPDFTSEIETVLGAGAFDFVIGSSHMHVGQSDIFNLVSTHNEYVQATLENTILAAQSGYFNAIAHLDMYRWIFTLPVRFPLRDDGYCLEKHMPLIKETLNVIAQRGLYMEINPHLATQTNDIANTFPDVDIVSLALEKGMRFYYGSDAHTADQVGGMLEILRQHPIYGKAIRSWEDEE